MQTKYYNLYKMSIIKDLIEENLECIRNVFLAIIFPIEWSVKYKIHKWIIKIQEGNY